MDLELQKFISHVTRWHNHQTAQMQAVLAAPAGTPIRLGEGDGAGEGDLTLDGDLAKGFRVGLQVALSLIGTLPFHVEAETPADLPPSLEGLVGLQVINTETLLPYESHEAPYPVLQPGAPKLN